MLDELHAEHFKVVLHVVIEGRHLTGTVSDPCTAAPLPSGRTPDDQWPPDRQVSCYWPFHKSVMDVGVDGWWPDQGDGLDGPSRAQSPSHVLGRHAALSAERAAVRAASQRVGRHSALRRLHLVGRRAVALGNAQDARAGRRSTRVCPGLPLWGTDIGGFYSDGRIHGRAARALVPVRGVLSALPLARTQLASALAVGLGRRRRRAAGDGATSRADPAELHNAQVEPICRKYLELRYRLMPYLVHGAARERTRRACRSCARSGCTHAERRGRRRARRRIPLGLATCSSRRSSRRARRRAESICRAGRGSTSGPKSAVEGGREIERAVDLATMPLYVRAGAVIPMGPVKQYTERAERGADDARRLSGRGRRHRRGTRTTARSFDYRNGEWMRVQMTWRDASRRLSLRLAPGSKMLAPAPRKIQVRVAGSQQQTTISFAGKPMDVHMG